MSEVSLRLVWLFDLREFVRSNLIFGGVGSHGGTKGWIGRSGFSVGELESFAMGDCWRGLQG